MNSSSLASRALSVGSMIVGLLFGVGCSQKAKFERALARGDEHVAADRFDLAESEYKLALKLQNADPRAAGRLGRLYYQQGRFVPSYLLLDRAVNDDPENVETRLAFGLLARTVGKTTEARAAARKILETQPLHPEALFLLAGTCVTTRDSEETRRILTELRARQPDAAGIPAALALLHLAQRDLAAAEKEARQAVALDPKSAAAHEVLGDVLLAADQSEAGREALRTAAGLSPLRSSRRVKYVEALLQAGATEAAGRELTTLTAGAPDFIPALVLQMNLAYREKRYADSGTLAETILSRDSTNHDALSQRAAVRIAQGDIDGGIGALNMMETVYTQSPVVKFRLAHAYLRKGDQALAEENLRKAIQLSPQYDEAILLLAELNLQKGNGIASVQSLTSLLQRQPRLARAYVVLAQAYQSLGRYDECLAVLRSYIERAPKSPEGHYFLALLLAHLGRADEARQAAEQALAMAGDYWPAVELLTNEDLRANRLAAATARLETAVTAHPRQSMPWLLRAKVRLHGKDTAGAEADARRAIETDASDSRGHLLLARILLQAQQLRPAAETLAQAAAKTPAPDTLVQLGLVHHLLGQPEEARAAYEKALAIDARFVPALNNLAALLSAQPGQLERALTFAGRARELAPNDPFVQDTLGWALHLRGQSDAALPHLRVSAEKLPGEPEVQFHLAMCLYQLGQEQASRQAFARVVESGAEASILQESRDRLALLDLDLASAGPDVRRDLEARRQRRPNDAIVLARLAALDVRAGAFEAAVGHYEAALKVNPRDVRTLQALVELHAGPVPKPARVRELSRQAVVFAPQDGELAWKLGRIAYAQGDASWAATTLRDAARILHQQPEVLLDHALAAYGIGRFDDAERSLEDCLAFKGPMARREEARRLAAMVNASRSPAAAASARADAEALLAQEPDYVPALLVAALAREQQKDFRGAQQTYEKIAARAPAFAPALRRQAIVLADQLGDDRRAEEIAQKVRTLFPDDPELNFALGTIHFRKNEHAEAVRLLRQSARARGDRAETHFYLGLALNQQKNTAESRASLQRALQLKLGPQEAAEARRVLERLDKGGLTP